MFKVAEVDAWLDSRGGSNSGDSDIGLIRQEMHKLKEENHKLELQVSELKAAKTTTLDRVGQFLEARETVRALVCEYRKKFSGTTDSDLAQADRFVVEFFNKVQAYLKLNTDTAQNNQVISK